MAVTEMNDTDDELNGIGDDLHVDELGEESNNLYQHNEAGEHDNIERHEAGGEDDHEEGEKEKYGQRVEKRIGKLTARAKTAEERAEAAERQLAEERAKHAERESSDMDAQHEEIKRNLASAYDEGDSEAIVEAQDQLADIRARMALRKPAKEVPQQDAGGNADAGANEQAPAAKAWLKSNAWFSDQKNQRYVMVAQQIEQELREEGYDLDDTLYAELDKRLEEEMPAVRNLRVAAKDEPAREPGHATTAAPGRTVPSTTQRKDTGRLNKDDIQGMRRYGLDPDSMDDRKAWINRNKL